MKTIIETKDLPDGRRIHMVDTGDLSSEEISTLLMDVKQKKDMEVLITDLSYFLKKNTLKSMHQAQKILAKAVQRRWEQETK